MLLRCSQTAPQHNQQHVVHASADRHAHSKMTLGLMRSGISPISNSTKLIIDQLMHACMQQRELRMLSTTAVYPCYCQSSCLSAPPDALGVGSVSTLARCRTRQLPHEQECSQVSSVTTMQQALHRLCLVSSITAQPAQQTTPSHVTSQLGTTHPPHLACTRLRNVHTDSHTCG
jgi:hypothetical protein